MRQRFPAGDPGGGRGEEVTAVEGRPYPSAGFDPTRVEPVGFGPSESQGQRSEDAVIRADQHRSVTAPNGDRRSLATDPRIDDRDMDGPGGKTRGHGPQDEGGLRDPVARELVREVHERNRGTRPQEGSLDLGGVSPSQVRCQGH